MKKAIILYFYLLQLIYGSRKAAYKKAEFFHKHHIFREFGGGGIGILGHYLHFQN